MNSWAFYPLYPLIVRVLMTMTGFPFIVAAPVVSLLVSLVGTIILFRLVLQGSRSRFVATIAVVALHTHPASPTFQVAYTEGLALMLIMLGLWLLREERYAALVVVGVLLSLTRPLSIVLAVVLFIVVLLRVLRGREQGGLAFSPDLLKPVAAMILIGASMGLWPLIAALATGEADAYTLTQAAWPGIYPRLGPWGSWIIGGALTREWLIFGVGLLLIAIVAFVASRSVSRGWGSGLRIWTVTYSIYVLVATRPGPSLVRYLLLVGAPVLAIPEPIRSDSPRLERAARILFPLLVCAGGLVVQYLWLDKFYAVRSGTGTFP